MKNYYQAILPSILIVLFLVWLPDFSFKIPLSFLVILGGLIHYAVILQKGLKKARWQNSKTRSQRHQN